MAQPARELTTSGSNLRLTAPGAGHHRLLDPDRQEVPRMCEEWFLFRHRRDAEEEGRRIWGEFERTTPAREPEPAEEPEPAPREREGAPVGAEISS
jgi:hypothetical protein